MTDLNTFVERPYIPPPRAPSKRVALVTTTIHVPKALKLLRTLNADVAFFVVADQKTPPEAKAFCNTISNTVYISVADQQAMEWQTTKHLPWNSIARRNIGVLEALKWGADIIIAWDDDNIPLHSDYFLQFSSALTHPFDGLLASSSTDWFDPGEHLLPRAPHRGFPHGKRGTTSVEAVTNAEVGVCAGMVLGDPDISAIERLANAPNVHGTSCLLQSGVVVDPRETWTVFNTQNTAYRRALAPAMLLCPQFCRYDDIIASLVTQRVMAGQGWHVRQGQPFAYQQRNAHDVVRDLALEMLGMQNIRDIASWLERYPLLNDDSLRMAQRFWCAPGMTLLHIDGVKELAQAWFRDMERVL